MVSLLSDFVQDIKVREYICGYITNTSWDIHIQGSYSFYYEPGVYKMPVNIVPREFKEFELKARYLDFIEENDIPDNVLKIVNDKEWLNRGSCKLD